ncbi:MAG: phosphodiester glycosidase family protein [Ruminococcus sp.]|nr:phosphodiester glycosidase family protein [Ruminococcus sp.]
MRSFSMRVLACLIVALMVISIIPVSVMASDVAVASSTNTSVTDNFGDVGLNVITDDQSNLAPGVTMNEVVAYDSNGDRVEMYITTADTSVDTVEVYANYKDNQASSWGLQTLSEQVAALEANYEEPFKVVAGINASYYNTANGKPTGAFVMEGVDVTTESEGNAYAFFAVLKDGTYMIGGKGEYSNYKGQIKEAIGGYVHIVKNGAVVSGLDKTTKYPRQTLGLTADGKLITMTADGSQVPKTIGLTYQEQAEVMLAMGCVEAIHLDGGNSATFGGVREGTDEFVLINTPSGNVERAVSNTLCIVSTAVADGTFDHATISGEYDYFLPYSIYTFSAMGIDASGGPADEIPADVVWTLSDSSFGTIENGTFTSNGKTGTVAVQMELNGKVVGSTTINVVNPTSISFDASEKTIPYGKTSALTIEAMYNLNEIYATADAFDFIIADAAAGSMSGFDFTATTTETITGTSVTAEYKYAVMDAISVTLKFGKGSEIIYDFEADNVDEWVGADSINVWVDSENEKLLEEYPDAKYTILDTPNSSNGCGTKTSSTFLATEDNGGQVKHGESALGVTLDRTYDKDVGSWSYNYLFYTGDTQVWRDVANGKNATKIGMWMYLPPEAAGLYARICRTFTKDSTGKLYTNYDYLTVDGTKFSQFVNIPEDGWVYAEFDLSAYNYQSSLQFNPYEDYAINNGKSADSNYYPGFLQFFVNTYDMEAEKVTIYIDDITLDYSDVTDDRHAPVISAPQVSASVDNFVDITGQTVTSNYLSFIATVAENTTKSNYTGLDYSTAKIYIDGIDMSAASSFKCAGTTIALSDAYLCDGKHEIVFEIADKQGNYTKLTKTLVVDGDADNAVVSLVGRNNGGDTPKAGSLYYIDVKASDASQVTGVKTTLKMQTANQFQLDYITAAEGVEFTYKFDELNNALTLDIKNNSATGETALVTIPVRVWSWSEEATGVTAEAQWATTQTPIVKIQVESVYGEVDFAEGVLDSNYVCSFYSNLNVATEVDDATKWHSHTDTAVDDLAATCTEPGYTGRTYCEGCSSIVDWGTTVDATGHNYVVIDGLLQCEDCDVLFSGEYIDGKSYVDGVTVGGWVDDSYYVDGVKLTGINEVDGYYYDFGDKGVCTGKVKYTGIITDADGLTRCSKVGVISTEWQFIGDSWYYFDPDTTYGINGTHKIGQVTYDFTNGKMDSGVWVTTLYGIRYYDGPTALRTGWYEIDGKDYNFEDYYLVYGGYQVVIENLVTPTIYYFKEDGSCDRDTVIPDGFYTDRNGLAYVKNGKIAMGLQNIDGDYYYFGAKGYAITGEYAGYLFGDDYKAVSGLIDRNGVLCYYENGKPRMAGLIEIDGDYYFAGGSKGQVAIGTQYVWEGNGILPNGTYTFGADGKMLQGIVDDNGVLKYYENGQPKMAGLIEVDGAYYFAYGSKGEVATDTYYVWQGNGILPEGTYKFGADGKMLDGVVNDNGVYRYYVNGQPKMAGLVEIDGDYYFASGSKGEVAIGTQYVWQGNGILPNATYKFGEDGKMLQGIVYEDGVIRYYVNGQYKMAGLVEVDGDYYFAGGSKGECSVGTQYVWQGNGILPNATYKFGEDGKMLKGIVEEDGVLRYYVNGQPKMAGLIQIDGDYYFAYGSKGEIVVDQVYYVWQGNGILPNDNYEFGADGKMLDGIIEKNGTLYYYETGKPRMAGLVDVDGDYYFAGGSKGEISTGKTYVWEGNGILPEDNYYFDENGKMLDGFVTEDGVLKYYENGKYGKVGLHYIDGYYYFIDYGAKVITDQSYYVWETNGYTIPMTYKFDSLGRVIL